MPRASTRKLTLASGVYRWKVTHAHEPDASDSTGRRCIEVFSAHLDPYRQAPLRIRFPHGPKTGWGWPGATGVIHDYRAPTWSMNLNRPSCARLLIELSLSRGWNPSVDRRTAFVDDDGYEALRARPDLLEPHWMTFPSGRHNYDVSFARFIELAGGTGRPKPVPTTRPRHDDDDSGPSLFRTLVEDVALVRLTLPGLFIGRSELRAVDWSKSALHSSTFCWSDFLRCWFTDCDLYQSDLRAGTFVDCDFSRCSLIQCDLRHAHFERCRFAHADLSGAFIPTRLRKKLSLSAVQADSATWVDDEGPVPDGG